MAERLRRVQAALVDAEVDALLVGPSADLRYLVGYDAPALERLTLLVLPADGEPVLVLPELERPRAEQAGVGERVAVVSVSETEDPFARVVDMLGSARTIAVEDHLWASFLLELQERLPGRRWRRGSELTGPLRAVKSEEEIALLAAAAAAIDRVHAQVPRLLRPGRREVEVARDIAELILEEHDQVAFTIVASGPNSASPHHEPGERPIERGDVVVVDIGGVREGYCSDETRTYVVGQPPPGFVLAYTVLREAQEAGVAAARAGVAAEEVDATCRRILAEAGYGEYFIHRTGHGIGMEVHEPPYIVAGNTTPLAEGMVFSVEPGIYLPGRYGARIEDIVVARPEGGQRLNARPRDLMEVAV